MGKHDIPLEWWLPAFAALAVFAVLFMRIGAGGADRFSERLHRIMWLALAMGLAYVAFLFYYFETDDRSLKHPWHAAFWGVIAAGVAVVALRPSSPKHLMKNDDQGEHKK